MTSNLQYLFVLGRWSTAAAARPATKSAIVRQMKRNDHIGLLHYCSASAVTSDGPVVATAASHRGGRDEEIAVQFPRVPTREYRRNLLLPTTHDARLQSTSFSSSITTVRSYTTTITSDADTPHVHTVKRTDELTVAFNQKLDILAKRSDKPSAERAERALREALKLSEAAPDRKGIPHPDSISFCTVINAWARAAYHRDPSAPRRAESVLQLMEEVHRRGNRYVMPNTTSYSSIIKAYANLAAPWSWSDREDRDYGPRKAEWLLFRMQELYESGKNPHVRPNSISFTSVLEAWCKSDHPKRAERVEHILRQMDHLHRSGRSDVRPTTISYNVVLDAWAKSTGHGGSQAAERAEAILSRMIEAYETGNDESVRPDAISFTSVIHGWARSGGREAAPRAEAVLGRMLNMYDAGRNDTMKPDTVCFGAVIDAWAKSGLPGSGEKAEELLDHMQSLHDAGHDNVRPNTITFNSVINAFAKSNERGSAGEAERILERMWELHAAGNRHVRPSTVTYNSVLGAYARSRERGSVRKAESLLKRMLDGDAQADTISFNSVINAYAKSKDPGKVRKAYALFCRMKEMFSRGNRHVQPTAVTYSTMMNACAFASGDDGERKYALKCLFTVMDELERSEFCGTTSVCYSVFLKACGSLIPEGHERDAVAEDYFTRCCRDGLVNKFVIDALHRVSPSVHRKVLANVSEGGRLGATSLPLDWTRHVNDQRRLPRPGHKDMVTDRVVARFK